MHRQNLLQRTLGHIQDNRHTKVIQSICYKLIFSNRIVVISREIPKIIIIQVDRNVQFKIKVLKTYNFEIFFFEPVHPRSGQYGIVGQLGLHDLHQKLTFAYGLVHRVGFSSSLDHHVENIC